jgi:hypothetical protein
MIRPFAWAMFPLFAAAAHAASSGSLPHYDLEMTSAEYRALTEGLTDTESDDPLQLILEKGKRNLDWIEFINTTRADGAKLELSTPATQRGIPITDPSVSNREIVAGQWQSLVANLPSQLSDVLINNAPFTADLTVTDDVFLEHARLVDRTYQRAARWLLQEPYLSAYAARAEDDVRGYYQLTNDPAREDNLRNYRNLRADLKANYDSWLLGICRNAGNPLSLCESRLRQSVVRIGNAVEYYRQHIDAAKAHWDSYFHIPEFRTDVQWTATNAQQMIIPFRDPQHPEVKQWLQENIEDEFRWLDWRLVLDFKPEGDDDMTHVEFVPGATPHVNGLAGSKITMDGNRNINEYTARWTIRHEYGHVLGFPDCYLEFYDEAAGTMINYQLDISDLMCSRKGAFKQNHYDQLRQAYFRN